MRFICDLNAVEPKVFHIGRVIAEISLGDVKE
jgi:hypothetical protein